MFYGWWNPWFILLMLGITVVNHACGRVIAAPGTGRKLVSWMVSFAIVVSLGTLGFFMFMMFLFIRFLPMISISETRVLVAEEKGEAK